jgi:hypothetical protein
MYRSITIINSIKRKSNSLRRDGKLYIYIYIIKSDNILIRNGLFFYAEQIWQLAVNIAREWEVFFSSQIA